MCTTDKSMVPTANLNSMYGYVTRGSWVKVRDPSYALVAVISTNQLAFAICK